MTQIPGGQVSASKFSTAFGRSGCGMKFYYRYVEGIKGTVNAGLLAGIAFDEATTQSHENRIKEEFDINPEDVFVESWENPKETNRDGELIEYDLSEAPVDILDRGTEAVRMYAVETASMKPLMTQVFVEASFEETDAKLIGYVDLVEQGDDGLVVTDVKSSISSRKKWKAEDAPRDAQLNIYSVLIANQLGKVVTAMGWRHARLGGKIEVGSTHVSAPDSKSIMTRVAYWMSEIERWCSTGVFPPTGLDRDAWVCSEKYCSYYNRCPFGARGQTTHIVQIGEKK